MVGDVRSAMLSLFGAVSLVLIIAAANVANLLLLRGEVRSREMAMRAALGAARGRIVSLLFAETLMLTTAAGAVAFVASWWSLELILTVVPAGAAEGRCDPYGRPRAGIHDGSRTADGVGGLRRTGTEHRHDGTWWRNCATNIAEARVLGRRALVAAQVALAVMIVAGAGLVDAQPAEAPGDRLGARAGSSRVRRPCTEPEDSSDRGISLAFSG